MKKSDCLFTKRYNSVTQVLSLGFWETFQKTLDNWHSVVLIKKMLLARIVANSKNYSKHKWFKLHRILSLKRQKITQMTQDLNWKCLRILWRLFLVTLYVFLNFDFQGVILFCTCVLLLDFFNRCSLFQLKK